LTHIGWNQSLFKHTYFSPLNTQWDEMTHSDQTSEFWSDPLDFSKSCCLLCKKWVAAFFSLPVTPLNEVTQLYGKVTSHPTRTLNKGNTAWEMTGESVNPWLNRFDSRRSSETFTLASYIFHPDRPSCSSPVRLPFRAPTCALVRRATNSVFFPESSRHKIRTEMRFNERSHCTCCQKPACTWLKSCFIKKANGVLHIKSRIHFRRRQLSNLGSECKLVI